MKGIVKRVKRQLALLVVTALVAGMLPIGAPTAGKAASSVLAEGTVRPDYNLNNPTTDANNVTTWDCIYFGKYWQEDANGSGKADKNDAKTPIKWRVLSVNGNDAFLLADKNLDVQRYNDVEDEVTWETCTMRSWLNGYGAEANQQRENFRTNNFLKNAFSTAEQSAILTTTVVNNDNLEAETTAEGGNNTSDKVYLLSIDEVRNQAYGFSTYGKPGQARNTKYVEGGGELKIGMEEAGSADEWWLRSPGDFYNKFASYVDEYGYVDLEGNPVDRGLAVRPALHLNLSNVSNWSYAGTVDSKGKEIGVMTPTPSPTERPVVTASPRPTFQRVPTQSPVPTRRPIITEMPEGTSGSEATSRPTSSPIGNLTASELRNPQTSDGATTWDCIYFGNYWQNDTNGDGLVDKNDAKQPIKWRILFIDGNDALLLADQSLDCQKYSETSTNCQWETCSIRSWLNFNFIKSAFDSEEVSMIRNTNVINSVNGYEKHTSDKVYLLSAEEMTNPLYGFLLDSGKSAGRTVRSTEYAKAVGGNTDSSDKENDTWWLRSLYSDYATNTVHVDRNGQIVREGAVGNVSKAVRPAMHIKLSSASTWSYAGTVISDEGGSETISPGASSTPSELNSPTIDSNGTTTWDCVYFGNYWQNDTNGDGKADKYDARSPIKWRVLSVNGNDAFLLADMNLEVVSGNTGTIWETCEVRSWLNGYNADKNTEGEDYRGNGFINNAFTSEEQSAIQITSVVNSDNAEYGTSGGNNTTDRIYLLSMDEAANPVYGFSSDPDQNAENRKANNTRYVNNQVGSSSCMWRLRSPGNTKAAYVDDDGEIFWDFTHVTGEIYRGMKIRPALHLDLSAVSSWSYAGTTASEGKIEVPDTGENPFGLHRPTRGSDGVKTWDCIYFGNYWKGDTNGDGKADQNDDKQPVKWRVLSIDGDDAFLLADKTLDYCKYDETNEDVTWETCTIRSWLNGYGTEENKAGKDYRGIGFINDAFTREEQSAIQTTNVENNTTDQVYLLSIDEVSTPAYGFPSNTSKRTRSRLAKGTEYTKQQDGGKEEWSEWWLRRGNKGDAKAGVGTDGSVGGYSFYYENDRPVRPALHLNLSDVSNWSYAGTIATTGEETDPMTPSPAPSEQPSVTESPDSTPGTEDTPAPTSPDSTPGAEDTPTPTSPGASEVPDQVSGPITNSEGVTTWKCVYFGNYWQEETNGDDQVDKHDTKRPIKWRVLSVNGNDAFLVADQNLDCQKYHNSDDAVTWRTCTIRSWLNGYGSEENKEGEDYRGTGFLNDAFTAAEQSAIRMTSVVNNDNDKYKTEGGDDTIDRVYLLSVDEVTNPIYGFVSNPYTYAECRRAKNTEYVKEQGAWTNTSEYKGNGVWWLRSPGEDCDYAAIVNSKGDVVENGHDVYDCDNEVAVRPALHLDLSAVSSWSYAGTVTAEGGEAGTIFPTSAPNEQPVATAPSEAAPGTVVPPVVAVLPQTVVPVSPSLVPASWVSGSVGKVSAIKLKSKKKSVTVSWKKVSGAAGYQVCYSTSKKWKKQKQKLVRKNKVTVKGLKKKKTYYFRVRAYRVEGTKKRYGAWSAVKKVKIKKA